MGQTTSTNFAEGKSSEPEPQLKIEKQENTDNEQPPEEITNQIELDEQEPETTRIADYPEPIAVQEEAPIQGSVTWEKQNSNKARSSARNTKSLMDGETMS